MFSLFAATLESKQNFGTGILKPSISWKSDNIHFIWIALKRIMLFYAVVCTSLQCIKLKETLVWANIFLSMLLFFAATLE